MFLLQIYGITRPRFLSAWCSSPGFRTFLTFSLSKFRVAAASDGITTKFVTIVGILLVTRADLKRFRKLRHGEFLVSATVIASWIPAFGVVAPDSEGLCCWWKMVVIVSFLLEQLRLRHYVVDSSAWTFGWHWHPFSPLVNIRSRPLDIFYFLELLECVLAKHLSDFSVATIRFFSDCSSLEVVEQLVAAGCSGQPDCSLVPPRHRYLFPQSAYFLRLNIIYSSFLEASAPSPVGLLSIRPPLHPSLAIWLDRHISKCWEYFNKNWNWEICCQS